MQPDVRQFLWDMLRAARIIREITSGKALEDDSADIVLRSAVERQFTIVGEALSQALKVDPSLGPRITDRPKIIAFRNILVHAYSAVEDGVVWKIVLNDLPLLERELSGLLAERDPDATDGGPTP